MVIPRKTGESDPGQERVRSHQCQRNDQEAQQLEGWFGKFVMQAGDFDSFGMYSLVEEPQKL